LSALERPGQRRILFERRIRAIHGSEQETIQPGQFFFHLASLMSQLCQRVFLAGEKDEPHIGFAELCQSAILHPALMHRYGLILAAEKDQGRRADALETIERRFEEIEKWILQR